jgi:hypothetical protein
LERQGRRLDFLVRALFLLPRKLAIRTPAA